MNTVPIIPKPSRRAAAISRAVFLVFWPIFAGTANADPLDDWQWRSRTELNSVTHGNGLYVAVGDGQITSSPDGASWTTRAHAYSEIKAVAHGNGLFVAVGGEGVILSSTDGRDWTQRNSGTSSGLCDIIYGQSEFVAVGQNGVVLTSTDGESWVSHASGTESLLCGVAYGNDLYVTVGAGGMILTSSDGMAWAAHDSNTDKLLSGVTWGAGEWIVVGDGGTILSSTDGIEWMPQPAGTNHGLRGVALGDSGFVIVGDAGICLKSLGDGTWSPQTAPGGIPLKDIVYSDGRYVCVGALLLTSTDGVQWVDQLYGYSNSWHGSSWGASTYIIVGSLGGIATSPDGIGWTPRKSGTTFDLRCVAYGNGVWIAAGNSGTIVRSTDLKSWNSVPSGVTQQILDVTYGNGIFVAVAGSTILTSTDGLEWTLKPQDLGNFTLYAVAYGPSGYVAVGSGKILRSVDTNVWSVATVSGGFRSVAYGNNMYLAVGDAGNSAAVYTSSDGISWVNRNPGLTARFTDVVFADGQFVGVGSPSASPPVILRSVNGVNWSVAASGATTSLYSIASDGREYLTTGYRGTILTSVDPDEWIGRSAPYPLGFIDGAGSNTALYGIPVWDGAGWGERGVISRSNDGFFWSKRSISPDNTLRGIDFAGNLLIAVGYSGTLVSSVDGLIWTSRNSGTSQHLKAACAFDGGAIVVGDYGRICRSTNNVDWDTMELPSRAGLSSVCNGDGMIVAVGSGIYSSPDATIWTARTSGTTSQLSAVEHGGGQFVAVGAAGSVITSPDGVTWLARTSGTNNTLYSVRFGGGVYVAGGASGTIITSPDCITWTPRNTGTSQTINSVVYVNERFVAMGNAGIILCSGSASNSLSGTVTDQQSGRPVPSALVSLGESSMTTPSSGYFAFGRLLAGQATLGVTRVGFLSFSESVDLSTTTSRDVQLVPDPITDGDGDGAKDYEEFLRGTNPANPDTDGDSMPDGWEITNGFDPLLDDADLDKDSDGLTNMTEYRLGTDLNHPDTDRDGINDGIEFNQTGSNPLLADTDGDGMPDKWEVDHGLDPRRDDRTQDRDCDFLTNWEEFSASLNPASADSDGNGTPDYRQLRGNTTWQALYDRNDRLLGVRYERGASFGYAYDGNGNPVRQVKLGRDGDGDGLPDLWEFAHGLDPKSALDAGGLAGDPDGDGWTNLQELMGVTDPNKAASTPAVLWGASGSTLGTMQMPFTATNFVAATGQLDGAGADEIVVGADGNTAGQVNSIRVFTKSESGWNVEIVPVGPVGVTSLAIGKPSGATTSAIYAGLRSGAATGSVVEVRKMASTWITNTVVNSEDTSATILGVKDTDLQVEIMRGSNRGLFSVGTSGGQFSGTPVLLSATGSPRGLGTQKKTGGATQTFRLLGNEGAGIEVRSSGIALAGLSAYYPLNGAGTDESGSGNHLQLAGTGTSPDRNGNPTGAVSFSGIVTSSGVRNPFAGFPTSEITTAFWIRTVSSCLVGVLSYASSAHDNDWLIEGPNNLSIVRGNTGWGNTGVNVSDGNWHHLAVTWRSSDGAVKIFKDGTLAASGSLAGGTSIRSGGSFVLGQEQDTVGGSFEASQSFPGSLDEVVIVNRVLGDSEIASLAAGGGPSVPIVIPEPPVVNRLLWQGRTLAGGRVHASALGETSVFYGFIDDVDTSTTTGMNDQFGISEFSVSGTTATLRGTLRLPIQGNSGGATYALTTVRRSDGTTDVLATGEPDGGLCFWHDPLNAELERRVFLGPQAGRQWHELVPHQGTETGEGLVGLSVDSAAPTTCNVNYWAPDSLDLFLRTPLSQSPPSARVATAPSSGGANARVDVRLWDSEGNPSRAVLQYQQPSGTGPWRLASLLTVDGQPAANTPALAAPPSGATHTFVWNALQDLGPAFKASVLLRARATDSSGTGEWSLPTSYFVDMTGDTDGDGMPDEWETDNDLEASVADALGDKDGDGLRNLIEFALARHANQPDAAGSVVLTVEGGFPVVTIIRNPDAAHLAFTVEVSEDLLSWHSGPGHTVVLEDTPALLKVRGDQPVSALPKAQFRLKVVHSSP